MQISEQKFNEIIDFIEKATYEIKLQTYEHESIIISMPTLILELLEYSFINKVSFFNSIQNSRGIKYSRPFFGCKIQPHYANEIVVFYEFFHTKPEIFKPKIHLINFES